MPLWKMCVRTTQKVLALLGTANKYFHSESADWNKNVKAQAWAHFKPSSRSGLAWAWMSWTQCAQRWRTQPSTLHCYTIVLAFPTLFSGLHFTNISCFSSFCSRSPVTSPPIKDSRISFSFSDPDPQLLNFVRGTPVLEHETQVYKWTVNMGTNAQGNTIWKCSYLIAKDNAKKEIGYLQSSQACTHLSDAY